jgi:hypothetical protein
VFLHALELFRYCDLENIEIHVEPSCELIKNNR